MGLPEQGPSTYRYFPRLMPGVGVVGTLKACLLAWEGGEAFRLLLLLSDSFDSIILSRAVSHPNNSIAP
jgi:hypothetical protein